LKHITTYTNIFINIKLVPTNVIELYTTGTNPENEINIWSRNMIIM